MTLPDVLVLWAASLESFLASMGTSVFYGRSTEDILNPSAWVTLRREEVEAELLLWNSGEAEFASKDAQGAVTTQHFEGLEAQSLARTLARLLDSVT